MPTRLLVKDPEGGVSDRPPEDLSELRDRSCWLDIAEPHSEDFTLAADELALHPLAIEDAQSRHQRPKIDEYETHYFLVVYSLSEPRPGAVEEHELSIFVAKNAIVTVHEGEVPSLAAVEKRFRDGKLPTTGLLLHAILDTTVDAYFAVVDQLGDRVEALEASVVEEDARDHDTHIRELFGLKHDLLRVRRIVAPEREVLAGLVRGDIQELREPGRRAYYQDVYDHILRVTDEIDVLRELVSDVVDAHLASVSNRLNEVMKVLTSLATVLLILTVITGFFGQNWHQIPYDSPPVFAAVMAASLALAAGTALYFRRRGWL